MAILDDVKGALRQTHDLDDALLARLIESAASECVRFLNITLATGETATGVVESLSPEVLNGVILVVQADYEGDPEKRDTFIRAAQNLWQPYRAELGV